MYCEKCGMELVEGVAACDVCGTVVSARRGEAAGPRETYDYLSATVSRDLATVVADCYGSLGYELTGTRPAPSGDKSILAFRRCRRVPGKAQLAKLKHAIDDLIDSIARLEAEKTRRATVRSLVLGMASALVLGAGMCLSILWPALLVPGVVVGIVGIVGCVAAYVLYVTVVRQDTARLTPRIAATYDSLSLACEEAQSVLSLAA